MMHMLDNIVDKEKIFRYLQTLQITGPSYLLMASLYAASAQFSESPKNVFNQAIELENEAKFLIKRVPGISVLEN
ncbi:orn/lys/arg decarboxylase, major domain protein [Medicago truncatula]|uniref:Orn/lys/arg decarboxylase, major domain protein n=1 Tax=Medicago truncatula TaxID=3880 RepID=A0A072USV2_MEDTR|nr:orn/lys/arg decarboxylase, major domain protein [Medicago truncatula]